MMFKELKILVRHGKQYIPDIAKAALPGKFRGRPVISAAADVTAAEIAAICPTGAIGTGPLRIDMGKCAFCGECALAYPDFIRFSSDYKIASNDREALIVKAGDDQPVQLNPEQIRKEIREIFRKSLKLRQVSAGGDNSCELELNACGNVNFDMGRFGIEFVASPRHADGVVVTGPVSANMAEALQICYDAIPHPKLLILCGTDAISGGIFAGSPAVDRTFPDTVQADLYVPGNPIHPLTFINGILDLIRVKKK